MKLAILALLFSLLLPSTPATSELDAASPAMDSTPAYALWIDQARKAAEAKYPDAQFVDFLYVGCQARAENAKQHTYKFWMKSSEREFGVYVTIQAMSDTNAEASVASIEETDVIIPSYGKWRRTAVEAVKQHYPSAYIINYFPIACQWHSSTSATQTFAFWLELDNKTSYITSIINHNPLTDEIHSIDFKPDTR